MPHAIPMLKRAVGMCHSWHIPLFLPRYTAALDLTYALDGRVAAGLALVEQGIITCGHGGVDARLQVSQVAQCADDPPTDRRDRVCDVGIGGRLALDKARLATLGEAIPIDAL
jgi:hypothetical protein